MPIICSKERMYLAAEISSNIFDDCRSLFSWEIEKRTKKIKCLFDRLYSWVKFVSVWVALGKRSPKPKLTPKSCFLRRLFLFVWPKRAKVDVVQLSEWGGECKGVWRQLFVKIDLKNVTKKRQLKFWDYSLMYANTKISRDYQLPKKS